MEITFKNRKLEKAFNEGRQLTKIHGSVRAKKIRTRMAALLAADNLACFTPNASFGRCHELTGNMKGKLSMDLDHPYRLIFEPDHSPLPKNSTGGLDWSQVTAIKILPIEDTHD